MDNSIERQMSFMIEQQARFSVEIQKVEEQQAANARQIEANVRAIEANVRAIEAGTVMIRQLVDVSLSLANNIQQVDERLAQRMDELASSHAHSDRRLDALIGVVEKLARRNGGIS